jgi:hypothetical protein
VDLRGRRLARLVDDHRVVGRAASERLGARAAAKALGAWQAAESGAPHTAAARFAGAFGPVALIVLVTLASLGGSGASPATVVVEGIVEVAAAVAGADALARRLEAGW